MIRTATSLLVIATCCTLTPRTRADLVVPSGETLQTSIVEGDVAVHGAAIGELAEPLTFGPVTRVTGGGRFENTLDLGVFAPGNSPGVVNGTNMSFGASATLEFELGGLTPGFGAANHDQINDAGVLTLSGGPTLKVLPFGGFVPQVGDEFTIMTWAAGLNGGFGVMQIDSFFITAGVTFQQQVTNPGGPGSLKLIALAVPEAAPFLLCGAAGASFLLARLLPRFRRKR